MKFKILVIMLVLILSLNLIIAQEIVEAEDIVKAGITPDSGFYNLEMAFEGFTEIFGESVKLAHAQERLSEAKVMIAEGKIVESKIAMQNFEKVRNRLKNKETLKEHKQLMDNLGQQISTIASNRQLTEPERFQITNLIQNHKQKIQNESVQIIAQTWNMNQLEAEQQFNQAQELIQKRITTSVQEKTINLNQQGNSNG